MTNKTQTRRGRLLDTVGPGKLNCVADLECRPFGSRSFLRRSSSSSTARPPSGAEERSRRELSRLRPGSHMSACQVCPTQFKTTGYQVRTARVAYPRLGDRPIDRKSLSGTK